MAANDAFTAGVRPGGLTNSTEIRLLLCYLVKNAGPISRQEIETALVEEALVNYFEIGSCLDDICKQKLVTESAGCYSITEKGRRVAQELAYDLPRSVRERAAAAVLRSQTWERKAAEYDAHITEKADGHCHCALHGQRLRPGAFLFGSWCAGPSFCGNDQETVYPERQRDLSAFDQ